LTVGGPGAARNKKGKTGRGEREIQSIVRKTSSLNHGSETLVVGMQHTNQILRLGLDESSRNRRKESENFRRFKQRNVADQAVNKPGRKSAKTIKPKKVGISHLKAEAGVEKKRSGVRA